MKIRNTHHGGSFINVTPGNMNFNIGLVNVNVSIGANGLGIVPAA